MLDLAVWTDEGRGQPNEGDRVRHTFYEKASASPKVFHAKGAYPWRNKILTLCACAFCLRVRLKVHLLVHLVELERIRGQNALKVHHKVHFSYASR